MATNPIGINIKQLPQINFAQSGDFFIIETPDGTGIIDFNDIVIDLDQTNFRPTIEALVTSTIGLCAQYTALSSNVYNDLAQILKTSVAVFKNISPLSGGQYFSGAGIDLPLNFIEVNQLSLQQSATDLNSINICSDLTLSTAASALLLPAGVYKTSIDASITSATSGTTWMQIYLYQNSPPARVLLLGSPFIPTGADQQKNLNIDGYFTLCKDAEVAIKATTYGTFKIGSTQFKTLYSTASASPLSASLFKMLQTSACNISMYLEKIADAAAPTINIQSTVL